MKRFVALALILLLLAIPRAAGADVAPPMNPPGANPGPEGEITQVRMMAETVVIEVLRSAPEGSRGQAAVTADFSMRNLGTEAESMAARFPISASDGFGEFPEIQNLRVEVDGAAVVTRRTEGPDSNYPELYDSVPWAEFDVTFPPGQDVHIRVTYTLEGTGDWPYVSFDYVLETGAGWKDTIGSADLIVRLPFDASEQNVILDYTTGWSTTTAGGTFAGREIRWHFEDLEPTRQENLQVSLVRPKCWDAVLTERENVARNPKDGEAWGRLGMAYKDVIMLRRGLREDDGGRELYRLGVEAYQRALELLPNDALWHVGFADLLTQYAYWNSWSADTRAEAVRAMQEIKAALDIAPGNPRVRVMAEIIRCTFPDGMAPGEGETAMEGAPECDYVYAGASLESYDQPPPYDGGYMFPWLTATPTAVPTQTPNPAPAEGPAPTAMRTATPVVTSTPKPAVAPTRSPSVTPAGPGLPCGSAAMVFIPLGVLLASRRRAGC